MSFGVWRRSGREGSADEILALRTLALRTLAMTATIVGLLASAPLSHAQNPLNNVKDFLGEMGRSTEQSDVRPGLSRARIGDGLKEALRVGTENVVGQLGKPGGFLDDPKVHIPLPGVLEQARDGLQLMGMSDLADDLEDRMNLAAEAAVPEAQSLFLEAIDAMTLDDAQAILTGPKDSATRYFQRQMRDPLSERMAPIVDNALAEAGAVQAYDALVNQYRQLPLVGEVRTNLTGYVLNEALDGLFYYVAEQEAAIRTNPAARTTQILKDVFG